MQSQNPQLFFMFLESLLRDICGLAEHNILPGGEGVAWSVITGWVLSDYINGNHSFSA